MLKAVRYAVLGKVYHDNPYGIEVDEASLEQREDASYYQSSAKGKPEEEPGVLQESDGVPRASCQAYFY